MWQIHAYPLFAAGMVSDIPSPSQRLGVFENNETQTAGRPTLTDPFFWSPLIGSHH